MFEGRNGCYNFRIFVTLAANLRLRKFVLERLSDGAAFFYACGGSSGDFTLIFIIGFVPRENMKIIRVGRAKKNRVKINFTLSVIFSSEIFE